MRRANLCLAIAITLIVLVTCGSLTLLKATRPLIVTTTSVLGTIVKDLVGDLADVEIIASPAVCPAHYDVRPSDVDAFRRADVILTHGFEPWVRDLRESSGTQAPVVAIKGDWNTPESLRQLYRAVANELKKHLNLDIDKRLATCLKAINETEAWLRSLAQESGFLGKPVVVMRWQRPFVEFLGFKVVASYGPPEMITAKEYDEVINNASKEHALLVIDNMQSGTSLGEKIATTIGASHVALTNFPLINPETRNVTEMMKYNARLLVDALKRAEVEIRLSEIRNELELWRGIATATGCSTIILAIALGILAVRLKKVRGGRQSH